MEDSDDYVMHGWAWSTVPIEVTCSKELSSNAVRLYSLLIWRAGNKGVAWPGEDRTAEDLSMSVSTIKRSMKELIDGNWIRRERRVNKTSITHIFMRKEDCIAFDAEHAEDQIDGQNDHENDGQTTGEPTVRPPVSRLNDIKLTRLSLNTQHQKDDTDKTDKLSSLPDKQSPTKRPARISSGNTGVVQEVTLETEDFESMTDKELQELMEKYPVISSLPVSEWSYWLNDIIPNNEKWRMKARESKVEDYSAVQHFNDVPVMQVIREFNRLWGVPIPSSKSFDKSRVKDWSNGARQVIGVCGSSDPITVMRSFKKWRDEVDPDGEIQFPRPSSIVGMLGTFIGKNKNVGKVDQPMLDESGDQVFYG